MDDRSRGAAAHQDQSEEYQAWLLTSGPRGDVVEWLQRNDPDGAYSDNASDRAGLARLSLRAARNIMRNMVSRRKAVAS